MSVSIAIVENEIALSHALRLVVNAADDFVCEHTFSNGEDALHFLPVYQPNIVLMDIDLGENRMNGIECIARLKDKCPNTLFMILTIYEDHQKVFDALSAGALGYVLKSASPSKIIDALIDLNEGGAPMSPSIARKIALSFSQPTVQNIPQVDNLTQREREVIELIAKGRMEKEVAAELFISLKTVKTHISNIYEKLQVRTRVEALNKYFGRA